MFSAPKWVNSVINSIVNISRFQISILMCTFTATSKCHIIWIEYRKYTIQYVPARLNCLYISGHKQFNKLLLRMYKSTLWFDLLRFKEILLWPNLLFYIWCFFHQIIYKFKCKYNPSMFWTISGHFRAA